MNGERETGFFVGGGVCRQGGSRITFGMGLSSRTNCLSENFVSSWSGIGSGDSYRFFGGINLV